MTIESMELGTRRRGVGEVFGGSAFDQQWHRLSYAGVLEPDSDSVYDANETVSRYFGIDLDEALQYLPDLTVFSISDNHASAAARS
jgi:hypothetical protein